MIYLISDGNRMILRVFIWVEASKNRAFGVSLIKGKMIRKDTIEVRYHQHNG